MELWYIPAYFLIGYLHLRFALWFDKEMKKTLCQQELIFYLVLIWPITIWFGMGGVFFHLLDKIKERK